MPVAGELMRILINHPDVELVSPCAPSSASSLVTDLHHGMVGECDRRFTNSIDPGECDVVFICRPGETADTLLAHGDGEDWPRIIDLSGSHRRDYAALGLTFGLSEYNRKALVRGARRAVVPSTAAAMALIAFYPPAAHCMLPGGSLRLRFAAAGDDVQEDPAQEILPVLQQMQPGFNGTVETVFERDDTLGRTMRFSVDMECAIPLEEVMKAYDSIYDDHNFTFVTTKPMSPREVAGTNKCLVTVGKPTPGTLRLEAVADRYLRGGAGEAVHLMNLLFGLHERTGLTLKASEY